MRKALLLSAGFSDLWGDILGLIIISIVLIPVSLALFRLSVNHARKIGSLVKY